MGEPRQTDQLFVGSIPEAYEQHLVPVVFQPYADDLADRVAGQHPESVLELACGTGVVTRSITSRLGGTAAVTATDVNQPMIDRAASIGTSSPVTWRRADAMSLPFEDASFDAVVCQFGVMFFPDRGAAFAEMHRVLRPGGSALFNVWDRIEANEFAHVVSDAVATLFPDDPPQFLARVPHGYPDPHRIRADLAIGGFEMSPDIEVVDARSHAKTCAAPAIGFCQGTPLRAEIEARDPSRLDAATEAATAAVAERFGETDIDAGMRALIVTAAKD